jgi:transposase
VKTWAAYFPSAHFGPVERTAQSFEDRVHHRLSEATLLKAGQELSHGVEPAVEAVQAQLRDAEVLHPAASGVRVNRPLHWLPVAATERLTHYDIDAKRGKEAMDEAGMLPAFRGTAVPDHWKAYCG